MDFNIESLKNFIDARRNTDNFWNIMFWLLSTLALYCIPLISDMSYRRAFAIISLIGIPILIKIKSPVTFTEAKDFVNSEGEIISKRCPLGFLIFLSIGGGAVIAGYAAEFSPFLPSTPFFFVPVSPFLASASFFFLPVSLFILKNCPISMLFHSKVYTATEVNGMKPIEWQRPREIHRSLSNNSATGSFYSRW